MAGIPVSNLITISINLSPNPAQGQSVNTALILGTSTVIDLTARMRTYGSLAAVAADFGASTEEYLSANLWFQQAPQPTTLNIGRWAKTAGAGQLIAAPLSAAQQALALWTAVTSGSFYSIIDGVPKAITGLNFSAVTTLNGVATAIAAALTAASSGATCAWFSAYTNFIFTSGTTGAASAFGFLKAPTAIGSYTFAGQPAANDTITINGTVVTFVASGATGNQVNIGASLTVTLASLLAFLSASADVQLVKFTYIVVGSVLYLTAVTAGTGGNALTIAKVGTNITVSGATLAGGSGTDISGMLAGLSTSSGAYVAAGVAAESALTAVQLLDQARGGSWYGLVVPSAVNADHLAIAAYIEAASVALHYYGITSQEAGTLVSATSTIAYQLKALAYKKTGTQYSSSSPYAAVSMLGRILTTDWGGNNTAITLAYKQEPGIIAETLTLGQLQSIHGQNANVIVNYSNSTAILDPIVVSASGHPIDLIMGLDAFAIQMQTDLYNLLYLAPTKIPQTNAGMALIAAVIESDCTKFVDNGLFAPGIWTLPGFGALSTNDFMSKGFYIYTPPVSSQSASVRATRVSVAFQIAVAQAGAVEKVALAVTVNL